MSKPLTSWPTALCLALIGAVSLASGAPAAPVVITVLDAGGQPVANAAVSIEVTGARAQAAAGTQAEMGQRFRAFVPSVLVVQTGTAVNFPNFDTVRHHIYSFSAAKPFEIKLYSGTPASPVVFDKPGTAILGCNIHDRMAGFIHVVSTPYFALSDKIGQVALDVPAGEHTLQIWHPGLGDKQPPERQPIKVAASSGARLTVRVGVAHQP